MAFKINIIETESSDYPAFLRGRIKDDLDPKIWAIGNLNIMRKKLPIDKRELLVLVVLIIGIAQVFPSICLGETVPVVASIFSVADMVKAVGGEKVEVTFILPPGASPHTFEPKPSLVRKISSARIFFMVGAGLEFWAEKFVKLAGSDLTQVVLSEGEDLIYITGHQRKNKDGHYHEKPGDSGSESTAANPHIWLDPVAAKAMVNKIVASLGKVDGRHSEFYRQRGREYLDELDKLDRLISATVATFSIKKFVAFHPSWDYFARRYGLEPVSVIEAAPGRNPTPVQIKNIVARIKEHRIRAVFAEPQLNPRAAEVIAKEAGVEVLLLDPVGGPGVNKRSSYIDLMTYNLNVLRGAMQ